MKSVVMSWRMPRDTRLALELHASRRNVRVCDLVRAALDEWFEINEPATRKKVIAKGTKRKRKKELAHRRKK
jgi:hypothetical protein